MNAWKTILECALQVQPKNVIESLFDDSTITI